MHPGAPHAGGPRRHAATIPLIPLLPLLPLIIGFTLAGCGGSVDEPPVVRDYAYNCGLPPVALHRYRVSAPTGPSCVGSSILFAEDATRREVLGGAPHHARAMQLRVWYPALPKAGLAPVPYSSPEVYEELGWPDKERQPNGNALANAPVREDARYPVLLFSPGLGTAPDLYAAMAEDLASHGYMVVGVNHAYASGTMRYPDGRIASVRALADPEDIEQVPQVMTEDLRFVLDWLQARAKDTSLPFFGAADLNRVGAYGHSIGGSAALQAQRLDARIKAAVNLDGTVWGDLSTPWTKPWMILYAEGDFDASYAPFQANPRSDSSLVALAQTGHYDFTDMPRWVALGRKHLPPGAVPQDPDLVSTDPEGLEKRLRTELRGFFNRTVK